MAWSEQELHDIQVMIPHLDAILHIALNISIKFDEAREKLVLINGSGLPIREINIADDSPFAVIKDLFEKLQ